MSAAETPSSEQFAVATESQRTLKDLKTRRTGQPVCVLVKFPDDKPLGYDPSELLLPCEIHEDGEAYFEIRPCRICDQAFPLTSDEFRADQERTECPECTP